MGEAVAVAQQQQRQQEQTQLVVKHCESVAKQELGWEYVTKGLKWEAFFNPLTGATLTLLCACTLLHYLVARDSIFWIIKWLLGSTFTQLHFYVTPLYVFARLLLGTLLLCAASHGCMHNPSELLRVDTKDAECGNEGDKEMITKQLEVHAWPPALPLESQETCAGKWRVPGT